MTQTEAIWIWALIVPLPLLINIAMRRSTAAVGVSMALLLSWCIGMAMWVLYPLPVCLRLNPLVDLGVGVLVFSSWRAFPTGWKAAVTGVILFQLCLHAAFWLGGAPMEAVPLYTRLNSTAYALCLCIVGGVGVAHGVGASVSAVLDRLRGFRHVRTWP